MTPVPATSVWSSSTAGSWSPTTFAQGATSSDRRCSTTHSASTICLPGAISDAVSRRDSVQELLKRQAERYGERDLQHAEGDRDVAGAPVGGCELRREIAGRIQCCRPAV